MTPREAVLLADNILDTTDYPWQGSESQLVAMEIKARLMAAVARSAAVDLHNMNQVLAEMQRQEHEGEEVSAEEPEEPLDGPVSEATADPQEERKEFDAISRRNSKRWFLAHLRVRLGF